MSQWPCEDKDAYGHVVHFHLELVPPHLEPKHPRAWYHRLGPHAHSLVILLKVKSAINDDPKIFYKGIYEGDEGAVLAWCQL
jgi:hypothetical protein